jgi:hypothetical protein
MILVNHPIARRGKPFSRLDTRHRTNYRDQIAMALSLYPQNTESAFFRKKGDSLDQAVQLITRQ